MNKYKNKYIKYKNKYNYLKNNIIGGGNFWSNLWTSLDDFSKAVNPELYEDDDTEHNPTLPPVQSPPVQSPPVQSPPVQSPPVQLSTTQSPPVQSPPVQSSTTQSPPAQSSPVQSSTTQSSTTQSPPAQSPPAQSSPARSSTSNAQPLNEIDITCLDPRAIEDIRKNIEDKVKNYITQLNKKSIKIKTLKQENASLKQLISTKLSSHSTPQPPPVPQSVPVTLPDEQLTKIEGLMNQITTLVPIVVPGSDIDKQLQVLTTQLQTITSDDQIIKDLLQRILSLTNLSEIVEKYYIKDLLYDLHNINKTT
jgi:hypothetical protein